MLVPAILYKDEIQELCMQNYYTDAMLYETGSLANWTPNIKEEPREGEVQLASVNSKGELLGFICYTIDYYADIAYNFGMMSKQDCNALFAKDVYDRIIELINRFHRVEWRMVGGNPVEAHYDRIIALNRGNKIILKDRIRDKDGKWHDDIIYEIVKENRWKQS